MNGCDCMGKVHLLEELMDTILEMNRENSVVQFSIPGKGKFTLVLEEEEEEDNVIKVFKEITPELRRFINESKALQKKGLDMSTIEHLKSLSARNFT
jgi:S-ribosylhomocysteine lyase LuxS involved in autoinducer biosynthesis